MPAGTSGRRWAATAALLVLPLAGADSRPDLYRIPLQGTGSYATLFGSADLAPARSPFGLATTPEGQFVFKVDIDVPTLPPPNAFGASYTTYVAWLASASLDRIIRIGPLVPGVKTSGSVAMTKFLVVITAEASATGAKWAGPIVMKGTSPANYLTNFSGHTMFNGGVPQ